MIFLLISLEKKLYIHNITYCIIDYIDSLNKKIISRKCHRCKIIKTIDNFRHEKLYHISGYSIRCKVCDSLAVHVNKIKKKYNITEQQYKDLLKKQDYKCAICGLYENNKTNDTIWRLSVDHDHKTNKIRGLLCNKCNNLVRDYECKTHIINDAHILRRIFNYLITTI